MKGKEKVRWPREFKGRKAGWVGDRNTMNETKRKETKIKKREEKKWKAKQSENFP